MTVRFFTLPLTYKYTLSYDQVTSISLQRLSVGKNEKSCIKDFNIVDNQATLTGQLSSRIAGDLIAIENMTIPVLSIEIFFLEYPIIFPFSFAIAFNNYFIDSVFSTVAKTVISIFFFEYSFTSV
jgi:hypothetical protein